ncbi:MULTISPECIES: hypothetical protein [unclassified Enterococcus]|jgi:hypothetical protein|uniref:hypothetical protein n=1 Tax=unclassified Enterococcus TaxID=2608891 RepID=UPI00035469B4|nr:hypothetical protein D920_02200 [Enterococcus faecalis 13-SD-W-01]
MLEIFFSKNGIDEEQITYTKPADFLAAQYLEVPPFEDHYKVTKALIDGQEIELADKTILGLFNYLNK